MCGITGVFDTRGRRDVDRSTLVRMPSAERDNYRRNTGARGRKVRLDAGPVDRSAIGAVSALAGTA